MKRSKVKIQIDRLKTKNCEIKINTLKAIGRMGEEAAEAVNAVLDHLKHESFKVRAGAATALGQIKVNESSLISALKEALKDDASSVRNSAAWALGSVCTAEDDIIPVVMEAYKAERISFESFAWIAGQLGEDAAEALPELQLAMENSDPSIRQLAYETVGKIKTDAELVVKPEPKPDHELSEIDTVELVKSETYEGKIQIPGVMPLEESPEEIEKALKSQSPEMRRRAVYTIGQSKELTEEMIAKLAEYLRDESKIVRRETRDLFEKLGPATVNVLIKLLDSSDVYMQETAMNLLEIIGESARAAAAPIAAFLDSENGLLKRAALSALGGIGDPASQYIDDIIDCMYDERVTIRRCAASALNRLGSGLFDTQTNEIKLFVKDKDQWVRNFLDFLS